MTRLEQLRGLTIKFANLIVRPRIDVRKNTLGVTEESRLRWSVRVKKI